MTTEKIYVVVGENGDYSEHSAWNVIATHSRELADDLVVKLHQLGQYNKAYGALKNEFMHTFWVANPRVAQPPQPHASEEYIQFNKIKKSTHELKQRYRELQAEHMKKLDIWHRECREVGPLN